MLSDLRISEFIVTCLIVEVTPGPNMAYLTALSATQGRRAGLAAVAGVAAGLAVYGVIAALGLAALVSTVPAIYAGLRWFGVLYLLWLAWDAWREPADTSATETISGDAALAWRSFLVNVLNPKAGIFFVAVIPEFIAPDIGTTLQQNFTLVAIYVAIATAVHLAIAIGASALQPWFAKGERRQDLLRRTMALALAGVAIWLFFSTRR
jgi:threonine/homoserine/homoserine lactone efflux protein